MSEANSENTHKSCNQNVPSCIDQCLLREATRLSPVTKLTDLEVVGAIKSIPHVGAFFMLLNRTFNLLSVNGRYLSNCVVAVALGR